MDPHRQRTLDSSMSSLYSGSNISNAPSHQHRQHDTLELPDMGGAADSGASTPNPGLRATTIGTVVVRCGPIQLVIALLQSPDKIYIKVVELEPKITTLGGNYDESLRMQQDHDETLRNIQNLPGPMDEFVQKADKLLASRRISSELVNAMADTLNVIWQDILHLLEDRQHILHLCTQFHDKMALCQRRMDQLEVSCVDTMLPIEVAAVQQFLAQFKQLRIDMLTAVMAALKDGNELLAQLQDLAKLETLDTRPDHIRRDATRSVHQVQVWLEALHDRRNALEIAWQTRKTQLEQCLALALLGRELDDVDAALRQQRLAVASLFSLGECEASSQNGWEKYREWRQQALVLRDRALKITRAKEKLQASGTFSGDEACSRAYNVLSACTEHLDLVDQREHWLQQARDFFAKAQHTVRVLDKLEAELAQTKEPSHTAESYARYAKVLRDVRSFAEEPLRLGYGLLDEVGRTQPETQGVQRVLEELENRKAYVEGVCSASGEDEQRVRRALDDFLGQYDDLLAWLMASGRAYLQQHVHMGRALHEAKQFLLQHHELMQDLEIKGELINLLLESIKAHLESLSAQQRYDVDSKAEALHRHWIDLKELVLRRVDCVSLLIEFFEKANQLTSQLDNIDRQLSQTPDEQKLQFLQATWTQIRLDFADLKNTGMRFCNMKIVDPYLETKSSTQAVEDILSGFSKRQVDVTTSLENWTTHITEKREVETILEKIMSDNEETASKTTKVDTQLYPVFTTPSFDAQYLRQVTHDKLQVVMRDIEKAQDEIQQRIHTTLGIRTKDADSLQKIEQVIQNLRTLKSKLDGIKYDYKTLLDSVLQFLDNVHRLRHDIDAHCDVSQQTDDIDRRMAEHERFRDTCMDKFRTLIAQSELLIDRVRILETPGTREIDTDRILKLLENLRVHFETVSSERMASLERCGKLEQFRRDLGDIDRSLDSVSGQLRDINGQHIDSLAAAKTTSLAFEYFERTIELLEKRIEKFTETTTQQLLVSNPESETYVREELRKLNDKWQQFKQQVMQKRQSLNKATEFFEMVEKFEAEYREISYFYNSVSNKITYLKDGVEAANLVNDIERYVATREAPLREKLDSAAKCAHDTSKVATLYNDVNAIFQSFMKLKSDIVVVQDRLQNEARLRELRDQEQRDRAAREQAAREAEQRERAARDEAQRLREQRELAERQQAIRDEEARLRELREQTAREQALREQAARDEEARLRELRDQMKRDEADAARRREHTTTHSEHVRHEVSEMFTELKYVAPHFTRRLADAVTREGERCTFECVVAGNPTPSVEWFKDGISIQNNPDYQATHEPVSGVCRLVIEETFAADSARFRCRASNLVGTADTEASLAVREQTAPAVQMVGPRIVRFLESGKATEGSSFQFACTVTGNPLPTVQWYKNDKCIDDSPDYVISYNNGEATLRFEEVFLEDDAVYTCSASNPAGIEHCSASLIVEPLEPTELPHFKIPLTNAMARVGQKIKLDALIGGIPRPDIYWLHNGKPYVPREFKYENGRVTLIIAQAYPNDAGVYVLSAKNLAGEAYSSCNVTVKGRLPHETSDSEMASDLEPIKPAVQLPLKNVSIFEGKPVRLDCVIVGQPEPEVIWYHDERPVKESADVQLLFQGDRCSLIIQEVYQEDGGQYKVVALNSAGEASSSCELKVTPLNGAEPATRCPPERVSVPRSLAPRFEKFLSDVLVDEGEPVELEVAVSGDQPLEAQWFLSNKPVGGNDERVQMVAAGPGGPFKLSIRNVCASDKGVYTVKVTNGGGEAKCFSHLIVRSVNVPETQREKQVDIVKHHQCPEFKELFSDRNAHPDEAVKFECLVLGKPRPRVHWHFNDQPVQGHNFLVSTTNGERQVLTIQRAGPDTVGKISCVAENEVGKATCSAFLSLIGSGVQADGDTQTMTQEHNTESSRVTIRKQTFTTTATSQVNSYEGNMPPQTEVLRSSAHIDQSLKQLGQQRPEIVDHYEESNKSMSRPPKSFVLVQSAETPTPVASIESPTRVRKQIAPRFTTPLTGKIVDQGADVSMEAIYDGFPSPEIKVQRNGEPLGEDAHTRIANKCNRVTIDLKEVGVADAGRYAITAINTVGQSTSTADLVVKKTIFPPVFGRRLQAQVVKRGDKIIMEVEVTGLPEPTVCWLKDDKPLSEAGLSPHRLLAQGNSHKLIIEKGELSDSGKFMVKATNAGGEAKSIADCAILEPSPERMQEVVKTIVYETPVASAGAQLSEFKTENFTKAPQSYQTQQTDASSSADLHGLSESKIITEHRCTTEATMRLEHKTAYLDLPEHLTPGQRPKTPIATDDTRTKTGSTQTPPPVPPKPCAPVTATTAPPPQQHHVQHHIQQDTPTGQYKPFEATLPPSPISMLSATLANGEPSPSAATQKTSTSTTTSTSEKKSSSFEYFKQIDTQQQNAPSTTTQKYEQRPLTLTVKPAGDLQEELKNLNLQPGSPPEICYSAKTVQPTERPRLDEQIKRLNETVTATGPPAGDTYKHETYTSKEVKLEYKQGPIMRPAATLPSPAQQYTRSPSPKPSAEGLAMSKLWTPTGERQHVSGYESCASDFEQTHSHSETQVQRPAKLATASAELSAPFLVQQARQTMPVPVTMPVPARQTPIHDIQLVPGTPPEICYAPKTEEGPSKVLPHSVPTLTPPPQPLRPAYKPPPPVMPARLVRAETNESDYESDRWKYSGSESDEASFRPPKTQPDGGVAAPGHQMPSAAPPTAPGGHTLKTSGYAADTEEISSYHKTEESRSYSSSYEATHTTNHVPRATAPIKVAAPKVQLEKQPPAQLYYSSQSGHEKQEFAKPNEFRREQKDFKCTYSSSSTTAGPPPAASPVARKTPAEFSDYSSEVDERFRSVSRTCDSEAEIKGYRVVYPPTPVPRTNVLANGHKSPVVVVTPSPMEFEAPAPQPTAMSRPKFEPIQREVRHEMKTETKEMKQQSSQQQQRVFKPKPVAAKYIGAASQTAPPTLYYNAFAGTPMHNASMATETKNVMQMQESSETCQRIVNMQQTKRIIHFDSQRDQQETRRTTRGTTMPPVDTAPRGPTSRQSYIPTPTKFVPGEFRESDYESEVENARIRPLWTPHGGDGSLRYRHVEPPHPGRSCSLPRSYERVLSPMEFDRGPEMPAKIQVDVNSLRRDRGGSTVTTHNKTHSLNRHSSMRSHHHQQQQQQQHHSTVYENAPGGFPRDDMNLKVGSPPKYGHMQTQAEQQGQRMSSTFMQKSHKFVEDISKDMHTRSSTTKLANGGPAVRAGFKRAPSEGDNRPQAYRDESRVSQYGTKCVDPNTGLIYFKYDFGYEFGILFPGEGRKFVGSQWNSNGNSLKTPRPTRCGEIIIPVQHERTAGTRAGSNPNLYGGPSDEVSFAPAGPRKRYSLPNTQNIDIYVDRLHANDKMPSMTALPTRAVNELNTDEPVNAHLNRDEHPKKPPMFITPLKDIAVKSGQSARFECIVQSHPQPAVTWTLNGCQLQHSGKHIVEYRNGVCRLTMPHAYPDDSGSYTCTAVNPLGAAATTAQLSVQAPNRRF